MNTELIIYGVIACIIAGLIIAIVVLARANTDKKRSLNDFEIYAKSEIEKIQANCDDEKEDIKKSIQENCNSKIASIEADYEEKIKNYKEYIENRKEVLSKMDEKELLVNVILALDTYGGRFDKLESFLNNDCLFQKFDEKINGMTGSISKQIDDTSLRFARSLDHTNGLIKSSVDNTAILNKLDSINSDIEELCSNIQNSDNDSTSLSLSNIENTAGSIDSTVNNIYSNMTDKYSYDTLASNIDELNSTIQEIKELTEEIKSEMLQNV